MWNSLPRSVRQAHSIQIFTKSVRDILILFYFMVLVILFIIVFHSNYLKFLLD